MSGETMESNRVHHILEEPSIANSNLSQKVRRKRTNDRETIRVGLYNKTSERRIAQVKTLCFSCFCLTVSAPAGAQKASNSI